MVDGTEELKVETPGRRSGRLPIPRLRRGDAAPDTGIEGLLRTIRAYNAKADLKEIQRAFAFAERAHEGQVRKSGEPFIEHPLAVAGILAGLHLDTTTLTAALL